MNYESIDGETPLLEATYHYFVTPDDEDRVKIVDYLLEAGANVQHKRENGETALHLACRAAGTDVATKLLQAGADVNAMTENGDTPLAMALKEERINSVKFLIDAGADVNIVGDFEFSTLHLAYRSLECVKLLLRAGVKINVMDKDFHNALQHALANFQSSNREICELLFAAGETVGSPRNAHDRTLIPVPEYLQAVTERKLWLKHQCRMTIRKHLISLDRHTHLFTRAPELGLPKPLVQYMLLNVSLEGTLRKSRMRDY